MCILLYFSVTANEVARINDEATSKASTISNTGMTSNVELTSEDGEGANTGKQQENAGSSEGRITMWLIIGSITAHFLRTHS